MCAYSKNVRDLLSLCTELANCPVYMSTHNGALSSCPSLTYITQLGTDCPHFEAWELARLDSCLYRRRFVLWEQERACCWCAFSDAAQHMRRDGACEVLMLYSGMTVDTVRGSGHNGAFCSGRQDEGHKSSKHEVWDDLLDQLDATIMIYW